MKNPRFLFLKNPLLYAFVIPAIYWVYLLFNTHMAIIFDALSFEKYGSILYNQGWIEFLKTEPRHELLYPLTIAISMGISKCLSVSYQTVQACFQIFILLLTQILAVVTLKKLKVRKTIIALAIFYIGVSPALVNSALSLWSEIITYPLVLGIILVSAQSLIAIRNRRRRQIIILAVSLATLFIFIVSVRAVFQLIFFAFLIPYIYLAVRSFVKRQRIIFVNSCVFILIVAVIFQAYLFSYKRINQRFNGYFRITVSGPSFLYGAASQRTEQLTGQRFLTFLASIPGEGACNKIFDQKSCSFWSLIKADEFGYTKLNQLKSDGATGPLARKKLIGLTTEKILQNPFQYTLLTVLNGFKIFFWESTKIGFVGYPSWLLKIFDHTLFKDGLRLLLSVITFISIVYLVRWVWKNRQQLAYREGEENPDFYLLFFIVILFFSYTALYSLFYIAPRYAFPIAPLYIIASAFFFQKVLFKSG